MNNTKTELDVRVGLKIQEARKSLGMTGADLAKKLGISQQQVSRYELGQTPMTISMVIMISHALNLSIYELLSDYLVP